MNGADNNIDSAQSLALAPNGDLYAVGYRNDPGESRNIWIRKYASNGSTKWTRVVDGSASSADRANDVAVDGDGNLYVVGYIYPSGGSPHIWIRRYNPAGAKQWTRTVTGVGAGSDYTRGATLDSAGNLYVVGQIYSGSAESNNI